MHLNNLFNETIRKEGDKYVVRSKKGKSMGSYDSKSAAEKRLRQVEMFKHMAESIKLKEAERDIQVEVPGIGVYTADTLSSNIIQSIDKLHRAAEAGDWEQVEYSLDPSKMGGTLLIKSQALVQALKQNRLLEAEPVGTATYTTTGSGIVVPEPKQTKSSTYQNIADLNKITDANKIKVGQKIKLPDGSSYKVKTGDTLGKITQDFNTRATQTSTTTGTSGSNLSAWEKTKNLVKDKLAGKPSATTQALDVASGKTPPPQSIKGARIDTPPVSDTISDIERKAQTDKSAAGEKKPGPIRKVAGGAKNLVGSTVGAGANIAGKTFGAMMYDQAFGTPDTIKNWFAGSENQSVRDFGDKYLTSKEGSLYNALGTDEFNSLALDDQAQILNHIGMGVAGGMAMIPNKAAKWMNKVPGLSSIPFGSKVWNNVMPKLFGLGSALKLRGDWQEAQETGDYGKFSRRLATAVSYGFIKHPAVFFATMALVDPDFDETRAKVGDYIVDKYNSALNANKVNKQATIGHAAVFESELFELWADDITSEMLGEAGKDACYHKVKSRYKVWPSAYASGALVKCRKVGAKNWGNKSKK